MQGLPVNGRQMSQLMLQAPGSQNAGTGTWRTSASRGRAVEQNVIKYDGIEGSAIIDAAPGNVERRERHAVQAAGEPRERAGVPRRVERLPGRVRHRHRRPGQRHHQVGRQHVPRLGVRVPAQRRARRAPTTSTRSATPTAASSPTAAPTSEVAAQAEPVRRLDRRADREGPRVLLRQLRGLPPGRRHATSSRRVPSAAAWARAVPAIAALRSGFLAPGRASSCRARRPTPTSTSAQLQAHAERQRERVQRPPRLQDQQQLVVVRAACSTTRATSDDPQDVSGRVLQDRRSTRPTRSSTCRASSATA